MLSSRALDILKLGGNQGNGKLDHYPSDGAIRMAIKARLCGISILLALSGSIVAWTDEPIKVATTPFLSTTGPYAVGTHEYLWIDQSRQDPFTKDPKVKRHLIVRVWYPAVAVAGAEKAPYIHDPSEFPEKSIYRSFQNVKTNAVTDAPMAKSTVPFPVLVYQPGGGTQRFIGTFETEELASHGYVVVSADHPGFSDTVLFPDGTPFKAEQHLAPAETGDFRKDVDNSWGWLNDEVFPTWTGGRLLHLGQDRATEQNFGTALLSAARLIADWNVWLVFRRSDFRGDEHRRPACESRR